MPVVFVSHGAPTLAVDRERGEDFARLARALPRPSALLVVSAHWEASPATLGTTETRELLYDFGGFPPALYRLRYPAPGAPQLAERVADLLGGAEREPQRPWDHGVWVPLLHMWPRADVPLLQLSLPGELPTRELFAIGRALAPLRDEGVLVLASGGMVHDLRRLDWSAASEPPPWALAFEGWVREALVAGDTERLLEFRSLAPDVGLAHPTLEHFLPLFVALGAAAGSAPSFPIEGFDYGSLSRLAVRFG